MIRGAAAATADRLAECERAYFARQLTSAADQL
jgi:hypothetical protein